MHEEKCPKPKLNAHATTIRIVIYFAFQALEIIYSDICIKFTPYNTIHYYTYNKFFAQMLIIGCF